MDCGTVGQAVLGWVWPQICAHCRDVLEQAGAPLCLACRLKLRPAEPPYCQWCSDPLIRGAAACQRCQGVPRRACRLVRAAFWYREAAVSMVHAFKYRGRRSAARSAGLWMAQALARYPELGRPDAVVPVPLHARRRRLRGYNQALLIAQALCEALDLPLLDALDRRRETRPQWALGREDRLGNLAGVIAVKPGAASAVAGRALLIVDDVCTSGASLEACAQALRAAGAKPVDGLVFARQGAAEPSTA